jgi:hypothetical protein
MRTVVACARVALVAPIVFAGIAATRAGAPAPQGDPAPCTVSMADSIPIGWKSTTVLASYTEHLGDSLSASFPDEARVTVLRVTRRLASDPMSAELTLNTENAVAGIWKLTLSGDNGICTGEVGVGRKAVHQE